MASLVLILFGVMSFITNSALAGTCKQIHIYDQNAPSGVYEQTSCVSGTKYQIYCEMGLDGGGWTFLSPQALSVLTNDEVQWMYTDTTSFILRLRRCDGTQPYSILQQLPEYASVPLFMAINNNVGYNQPVNAPIIGVPYAYFGFLPISNSATALQGLQANDENVTFTNCDGTANGYIALFPNYYEAEPSTYLNGTDFHFCDDLLGTPVPNPSTRVMPPDLFMFMETQWGGCGCYTQTDERLAQKCILGANVGFR